MTVLSEQRNSEPLSPATAARPWRENLFWAIFLIIYGCAIYYGTNRLVNRMPGVRTFYVGWDRHIPFVPWFIIPYWSSDALYAFGPLLCTSRAEVRGHAKRMMLAFLLAAPCFVFLPVRFAFARPAVSGALGPLFALLDFADRPVNLVPSLHVTEIALLWVLYVRHTRGWLRWTLRAWMLLVIASTMLVWQHHITDVLTGFALAMLCFAVFPDRCSTI